MPPSPYATPPAPYPAAPLPQAYAPPPIPPTLPIGSGPGAHVAKPKSRAPLFIIVGLLAFGGAGAAVWMITQSKKDKVAAKTDEPDKGSATTPPPEHHDETTPAKEDPWGDKDGSDGDDGVDEVDGAAVLGRDRKPKTTPTPTPTTKTSVGTAKVPLPAGAYIDPPDGFTATNIGNDSKAFINASRGILIAMGPLDAGSNDPNVIAKQWTKATTATLIKHQKVPSHGAPRDMLVFTANYNGVAVGQIAVLYITDSYRIGVLLQAPAALFTDESFQHEIDELYEQNVHLP